MTLESTPCVSSSTSFRHQFLYIPDSPIHASNTSSFDSPLCSPISSSIFHLRLKTYLFRKSFPCSFTSPLRTAVMDYHTRGPFILSYPVFVYSFFFVTGPPNMPVLFCTLSSVGVVCRLSSSVMRVGGRLPPGRARGRSGGRHCTAGHYGYVSLGRHHVSPVFGFLVPCARLSWPFRQLLSARKYTISYHMVSCRTSSSPIAQAPTRHEYYKRIRDFVTMRYTNLLLPLQVTTVSAYVAALHWEIQYIHHYCVCTVRFVFQFLFCIEFNYTQLVVYTKHSSTQ